MWKQHGYPRLHPLFNVTDREQGQRCKELNTAALITEVMRLTVASGVARRRDS